MTLRTEVPCPAQPQATIAKLLLGATLVLGVGMSTGAYAGTKSSGCATAIAIEGTYDCHGECVVTEADGSRKHVTVSDETDVVQRFPGANDLYQVHIDGNEDFHELEMGALAGLVLRTATVQVSDGQYPVLEEYIFTTDPSCRARGFTKIVRNPSPEFFKACAIQCQKRGPSR